MLSPPFRSDENERNQFPSSDAALDKPEGGCQDRGRVLPGQDGLVRRTDNERSLVFFKPQPLTGGRTR